MDLSVIEETNQNSFAHSIATDHDIRSTKRKQQKRQMLANKAAEEEMEEISKERDNLLKEIMSTKGGAPRETEVADGVCKEHPEAVGKELVKDDELQSVITCKKVDKAEADAKFTAFDGEESSAVLEFVEPPETCIPAQQTNPVQKPPHGNNSLEENPSPLSQMSPLTFSPPLSCPNELMDVEGSTGNIVSKIHSRRFRELVTFEIEAIPFKLCNVSCVLVTTSSEGI